MSEIAGVKGPRNKAPRRISSAAKVGLRSNVDVMLAASGMAIAFSSMVFAGYMVADVDRPPRIAGMEYLSVFAKHHHRIGS